MLTESELTIAWQKFIPRLEKFTERSPSETSLNRVRQAAGGQFPEVTTQIIALEQVLFEKTASNYTYRDFPLHLVKESYCAGPAGVLIARQLDDEISLAQLRDNIHRGLIRIPGTSFPIPGLQMVLEQIGNDPSDLLDHLGHEGYISALRFMVDSLSVNDRILLWPGRAGKSNATLAGMRQCLKLGGQRYETYVRLLVGEDAFLLANANQDSGRPGRS